MLTRSQQWIYAAFGFPLTALYVLLHVQLPKFYSDAVGVDLGLVGGVMVLARILDAVTDPFVGLLSDRCRHRFGRRRFFLAVFPLPFACSLLLLFHPPLRDSALTSVWFVSFVVLSLTTWNFVSVPYDALGVEITREYDERTRVLGLRDGLGLLGLLAAAGTPPFLSWLFALGPDPAGRRSALSLYVVVFSIPLCLSALGCVRHLRERPGPRHRETFHGFRALLRNAPFWLLLCASTLSSAGASIPAATLLYFVHYVVRSQHGDLFLLAYVLTGVVGLPLWVKLSKRADKRVAWVLSLLVAAAAYAASYLLWPLSELWFGVLVLFQGLPLGALIALPAAMEADVIDYGARQTGVRQEGLYLGLWSVARGLAGALGVGLALSWVDSVGYVPNHSQSPQVVGALRGVYGLAPAAFFALAALSMAGYRLGRAQHRELVQPSTTG